MSTDVDTWLRFTAIGLLPLVLATLIGAVLSHRAGAAGPGPVLENFVQRVESWWVMAVLLSLAFIGGETGVVILSAVCSFAALREFITLIQTRRGDHWALAAVFFIALPLQYYLVWIGWYALYAILIPVYAFLGLPILSALRGDTDGFLDRVAGIQWALMICVYCLSHLPALLYLEIPGFGGREILLIAFLVFVVQISDVLQYAWGKLCGRHKIAPRISPGKTVEGFVGGVLSASAVGAALWWMTPFAPLEAAAMALLVTVMGFLGGLVMSAIKRDRGVKDWGHLIPGHGGFIDRLDSVVFAAPVFFHVTRYFWSVT
ncbi:MAG: phosphatidate cytidylyltransferase [Pseudomonadota bacterium]